jgi:hypothetical protein
MLRLTSSLRLAWGGNNRGCPQAVFMVANCDRPDEAYRPANPRTPPTHSLLPLPAGRMNAAEICEKYYNQPVRLDLFAEDETQAYWALASITVMKTRSSFYAGRPGMAGTETHSMIPMIRLFDQRDIEFLRALPGHTRRMETEFRRRRCRIFRGYLRSLRAEFLVAQTEAETLRIEFPEEHERPALTATGCRVRFACAMTAAYFCLFRYRWDLGGSGPGPVVRRFEGIRGEIRRWAPGIS